MKFSKEFSIENKLECCTVNTVLWNTASIRGLKWIQGKTTENKGKKIRILKIGILPSPI